MTGLSDYVLEILWEGDDFALYRGRRDRDQSSLLAVAPVMEHPPAALLKRLNHEYALRNRLDPAWSARPLGLTHHDGRAMLVLEDCGGEPLTRLMDGGMDGGAPDIGRFLRIAIGLATALGRIHGQGLIHKDLRPDHVLIEPASGSVHLTGFGLASQLRREQPVPEPPEAISGTLAYMAPEQTGRMNRAIDARSDLYALGITLYEMLTGALPFTASDPMELVHCHIARLPAAPAERIAGLPGPLSDIVMKLLAKTAEDRYQTAAGVAADLRRCLEEWEAGALAAFPLGSRDVSGVLRIPEKLYGREPAADTLLDAFRRVATHGTPELVLLSGPAGIGKSSVAGELHKAVVPLRGLFAQGKADLDKRDIPYATLAQVLGAATRQLLVKSERELGAWRAAIGTALAGNGQLVVDLVPDLERLIGPQPPVAELPPHEAERRVFAALGAFLRVFADGDHPLALFFDDLQWLDAATLDFIADLAGRPGAGHLLIVGACRDDEPDAPRRMARLLDAARAAGTPAQRVAIGPLAAADVGRMVADTVGCAADPAWPLAELIHRRTGGNPFFAIQLLKSLADDQLLAFDAERTAWTWDIDEIRARAIGEDVVALMVETLRQLPPATQQALTVLACLGNGTALQTLATVVGEDAGAVHATLWDAVREGVVIEQGDAYRFDHDRVQEAAYLLVPEVRRTEIHLAAGRLLAGDGPVEALRERVFDIVNQYNRALPLVSEPAEKARLASLNLLAGRRAKASAAYQAAGTFLGTGMALLGGDGWDLDHDLTFALALERAECEYLCGDVEAARGLIASLLRNAVTIDDRAAAYRLKMDLHVMRSEQVQAVDSALECLRLLGVDLPAHPTDAEVAQGYQAVWDRLGDRPADALIDDLPLMTDPHLGAAMQVLSHLFSSAFATDANLLDLHVCRMVALSLDHGVTGASSHGFAWFGLLIGPRFRRYADGHRFGRLAVALVQRHDFAAWRAKAWFSRELVDLWTQPIDTATEFVRDAFRMAVETGDLTIACYSCHHILVNRLLRGDPLEDVWRESESFVDFLHGRRFGDVGDNITVRRRFIRAMQGRSDALASLGGDGFDEAAFEARLAAQRAPQVAGRYWIVKLQTRFVFGDHETARAAAAQAGAVIWAIAGHIQLLDYHYYAALTLAARHDQASPDGGAATLAAMAPHLAQLAEWAEHGAATFRDKHLLASAEAARVRGEDLEAMQLYEQAIQAAADNRFVQNQAIAHELAGRFHLDRGLETAGHAHLRRARACYALWGAEAKVRQLDRLYPRIAAASGRQPEAPGSLIRQLDATTVIQACHALSAEIVLPRLVETLMTSALRNAGADRGLLILPQGDGWRIEAEAAVDGDAIAVDLRRAPLNAAACPESLLRYAIRTEKAVILDDAARPNLFSEDPYLNRRRPRSVAALPLLRQGRLAGLLYLENSLASEAFPHARVAILELLAAQAAISLDNARLYAALEDDLGARRQAEAALREARDQAEIANRAKSTFLANMSHELRTPLNAILGFAEIMKLGLLDQPDRYRAYAEDIHASGCHLLEIINDLLDVVQIESGRLTLDARPVDLPDVIAQVLRLMAPQLDAARLSLATEISADLPPVLADERAIRQILLNLLSNAAKFTEPGGRVTVGLGRADCGDMVLTVEDTGIGIAAADIDKLMQPFAQLDGAYERRRQGTGLGLFLVRSLAELHSGAAHIASRPGQGTIVTIRLPAARVLAG